MLLILEGFFSKRAQILYLFSNFFLLNFDNIFVFKNLGNLRPPQLGSRGFKSKRRESLAAVAYKGGGNKYYLQTPPPWVNGNGTVNLDIRSLTYYEIIV